MRVGGSLGRDAHDGSLNLRLICFGRTSFCRRWQTSTSHQPTTANCRAHPNTIQRSQQVPTPITLHHVTSHHITSRRETKKNKQPDIKREAKRQRKQSDHRHPSIHPLHCLHLFIFRFRHKSICSQQPPPGSSHLDKNHQQASSTKQHQSQQTTSTISSHTIQHHTSDSRSNSVRCKAEDVVTNR